MCLTSNNLQMLICLKNPTKQPSNQRIFWGDISPPKNVIVWLDFEYTYYDITVQHDSNYVMETNVN